MTCLVACAEKHVLRVRDRRQQSQEPEQPQPQPQPQLDIVTPADELDNSEDERRRVRP